MTGGLYLVTDAGAPVPPLEQALAAARAGARLVQLRDKAAGHDDLVALARAVREAIAPLGARLIVNDRVAAAVEAGADGLHLGQGDGDPRAARAAIGPGRLLGLSVEAEDQLAAVPWECVDHLGVGPVRATATKPDHAPPLGFDGLARVVAAARVPCFAIGGLGPGDMAAVRRAGAVGAAVVSAVTRAPDPGAAARALMEEWRRA